MADLDLESRVNGCDKGETLIEHSCMYVDCEEYYSIEYSAGELAILDLASSREIHRIIVTIEAAQLP